jgi:hypothetical protein
MIAITTIISISVKQALGLRLWTFAKLYIESPHRIIAFKKHRRTTEVRRRIRKTPYSSSLTSMMPINASPEIMASPSELQAVLSSLDSLVDSFEVSDDAFSAVVPKTLAKSEAKFDPLALVP